MGQVPRASAPAGASRRGSNPGVANPGPCLNRRRIQPRIDAATGSQFDQQLLLRSVPLQLVAGIAEKLQVGNVVASAAESWDHMVDSQIPRLEVVTPSGAVPALSSVQDRVVHSLPRALLLARNGFSRRVVGNQAQIRRRCLGSQFHLYFDRTGKSTGLIERKTPGRFRVEVGLDLDPFRYTALFVGQRVCFRRNCTYH